MKTAKWTGPVTGHTYTQQPALFATIDLPEPPNTAQRRAAALKDLYPPLKERPIMYLIQRKQDQHFFVMLVDINGTWTTSRGWATWYPSIDAAKQLIDIKARNGEWDASAMEVVKARL